MKAAGEKARTSRNKRHPRKKRWCCLPVVLVGFGSASSTGLCRCSAHGHRQCSYLSYLQANTHTTICFSETTGNQLPTFPKRWTKPSERLCQLRGVTRTGHGETLSPLPTSPPSSIIPLGSLCVACDEEHGYEVGRCSTGSSCLPLVLVESGCHQNMACPSG